MKPHSNSTQLALGSAILLAFLYGCTSRQADSAAANTQSAVSVSVAKPQNKAEELILQASGSFVADESSILTPQVEGLIMETPISIGQYARQGSPIVVLDPNGPRLRVHEAEARESEAQAALVQAQARMGLASQGGAKIDAVPEVRAAKAALEVAMAELKLAQTEETRAAKLLQSGDVSKSSYDRALASLKTSEARVASAQEQLEAAKNQANQSGGAIDAARASLQAARAQTSLAKKALADSIIRAPFSGFLSERSVSVGEYVTTSTKLGRLDKVEPLKLQLQVPESDAAKIKLGSEVKALSKSYGQEIFAGRVTVVNSALDPISRSVIVEAIFTNSDRRLKPGMFATAAISLGESVNRVVIPKDALRRDSRTDTFCVWVVESGKARLRTALPGRSSDTEWSLISGLRGGEDLIVGGEVDKLIDGIPVRVSTQTQGPSSRGERN